MQKAPHSTAAAEQVCYGAEQVHPAYLSQYAPPACAEEASVRVAERDRQEQQDGDACSLERGFPSGLPGVIVPDKEETYHHEQPVSPFAITDYGGYTALCVDYEGSHEEQRQGAPQDMPEGAGDGAASLCAPVKGQGDRHAHGKEEHGIHDIRQAHAVLPHGEVLYPVGDAVYGPDVVYGYHKGHGEAAEHVYGEVSLIHSLHSSNISKKHYICLR